MVIQTKGIVLKVIRYSDTQEIHTLFTEQMGLISLITKVKKRGNLPPLYEGEFTLRKGKNFFQLVDARQTAHHHLIRERLLSIETAFQLIHILLKSQMPLKPAPALYALFGAFLKQIPSLENLPALKAVFIAKLLLHEGHLDPDNELLSQLAVLKSFKDIESFPLPKEGEKEIDHRFDEAYDFVFEKN